MRVRTQLLAAVISAFAVSVAATVMVFATLREEEVARVAQSRAQVTAHEVASLLTLTYEYARYSEARAAQQWHQRHGAIAAALTSETQESRISPSLVELQAVAHALPTLFSRLEQIPKATGAFDVRRKEALLDQLLTSTQAMNDYADQWFREAAEIRRKAEVEFELFAVATPSLMVGMLVLTAVVIRKRILIPMKVLGTATTALRAGDMTFQVSSNAADEFGDLSRQFDGMTVALKEARQHQAQVEKQLRAIADNLPVLIAHIDGDGRFRFVNQTFKDWLGMEQATVLGRRMEDVMPPAWYEQRREYLHRALSGERISFDMESDTLGIRRSVHSVYIPDIQTDGSVAGIYTLSTDVSALKSIERQLNVLARSDAVTGLANRYQFNETLPLAIARAKRSGLAMALMSFDIDHFKQINDTLGHAAGDAVLREFAARLQHSVRVTDTVARLGGDEFVIILEGLHSDAEPQLVARKIIADVNRPFDNDGAMLAVTASVGLAYGDPAHNAVLVPQLLAQADEALYAAKRAGRNTFRIADECV